MDLWQCLYLFALLPMCCGKMTFKSVKQFIDNQIEQLSKNGEKCLLKKLSRKNIDRHRLKYLMTENQQVEICHINYLIDNERDGFVWSSLADIYSTRGKKFSAQANFCYKQALQITGKHTPFIKDWHFLGPFGISKTEFDGDPVESYGGIRNASVYRYTKNDYYSELMPLAVVRWFSITQNSANEAIHVAPNVQWNDLVNSLGSLGITEFQGWLVGDFAVNAEDNYIFQCLDVVTFYIDDIPLSGDVYQRRQYWFSSPLDRGIHTIYVPVRNKISANIHCLFQIAPKNFKVSEPPFLPHLYDGYLFGNYIHIPVSNLHSTKWLKNIRFSVAYQSQGETIQVKAVNNNYSIAPGQSRPIIVKLTSEKKVLSQCTENSVDLKLKIATSEGADELTVTLRCRNLQQSVVFTFLDHDGSVQHAAAIKPISSCLGSVCPVMITFHGTTVPPQNQADSYKHMINGEFVFGVENMWLLAPTRHGAHNWEGPGLLTALTALEALKQMIERADWLEYNLIDTHQLMVAGHSMGGHGAWHLATHYPDRVMALVSLAGWIKKEEYGDSNLFFKHDISTSYTDPVVKSIMELCIAENDADKHITNLQEIPVYARIGGDDRTVHPYYVRRMVRLLNQVKVKVEYSELSGKEHWWWDTSKTNDGGAVNDESIRNFVARHSTTSTDADQQSCSKDGECDKSAKTPESKYSNNDDTFREFTLTTVNPALGEGLKGIKILQQIIPYRTSQIHISIGEEKITLTTDNVVRFSIGESKNRRIGWNSKEIQVDKTKFSAEDINNILQTDSGHLHLGKGREWKISSDDIYSIGERGPENLGPARRVAEREFLIIVGTKGDSEMKTVLLSSAVYIANLFYLTSDTIVNIVLDTDVSLQQIEKKNAIILGNSKENSYTEDFLSKIPLKMKRNDIILENCVYGSHTRTGVITLAPNNNKNIVLIIFGNSKEGLLDAVSLAKPTIPPMTRSPFSNLLPDFVITGPEFRLKGPGGFQCLGFWNNQWKYQQELSSCICG